MRGAVGRGERDVGGHAEVGQAARARERRQRALAHVDERPDDADVVVTGRKKMNL